MSDSATLSLTLPRNRQLAVHAPSIDLEATYCFSFVRERWLPGAGKFVQSILMMGTGGFLFTQISSTPNLRVQMAIIASLLCFGGLFLISRVWSDFLGKLTLDKNGVSASYVWSKWSLNWSEIKRWRINETAANIAELACVEVWAADSELPKSVPGGHLREKDLHLVRHLFYAFAKEQEDS